MARSKKSRAPRRSGFNISKFAENFVQAEILVRGTTGSGIMNFFRGDTDLGSEQFNTYTYSGGVLSQGTEMRTVGAGQISLGDLVSEPTLALQTMYANGAANLLPMAVASITTRVGFKLFRTVLAPQRRSLNALARQVLGRGQITF